MKQKLTPICLVTVLHTLFALLGHNVTSRPEVARTSSFAHLMFWMWHYIKPLPSHTDLSHSERVSNMKVITEYELNKSTPVSESLLRMQDSILWGPTGSTNGDLELGWTRLKRNPSFHSTSLFSFCSRVSLPWAFMSTAAAEVIAFLWPDFTPLPVWNCQALRIDAMSL